MHENSDAQVIFLTLGCRLNQIESEAAARFFVDAGFSVSMDAPAASSEQMRDALLCVVNTCAVTQKAEQKARREIRLLLEKCPAAALVVTGCYAELSAAELSALDSSAGEENDDAAGNAHVGAKKQNDADKRQVSESNNDIAVSNERVPAKIAGESRVAESKQSVAVGNEQSAAKKQRDAKKSQVSIGNNYIAVSNERVPAKIAGESRVAVLPGLCKSRLAAVPEKLINFLKENEVFDARAFAAELRQNLFAEKRGAQNAEKKIATGGERQGAKKNVAHENVRGENSEQSFANGNRRRLAENPFLFSTDTFLAHSRASLKVQDGCGSRCSYCAIRLARGNPVSLSVSEILRRVEFLKSAGHKEIALTGVNLAQYRDACGGKIFAFADLLEALLRETSGVSFLISSVYPEIVDARFCKIVKDERVRPHFHLSVQSGSDSILRAMRRNYVGVDVLRAVQMLREAKPNAFFACDIIAGFPGETDGDFEKTLSLVRTCKFAYVHAFPFSARRGTEAYSMKPKVPERVAKGRVAALLDFAAQSKIAYIDSCAGKTFSAIAESKRLAGGAVSAVTENFLHCRARFCGDAPQAGSEIRVRVTVALESAIRRGDELEADAVVVE